MILSTYDAIKHDLKVGDCLFFGGRAHLSWSGFISWGIEASTGSPISHVAAIISRENDTAQYRPAELVESTSLAGKKPGCITTPAEWRVDTYDGRVWWAPLSDEARARFDEQKFIAFMLALQGHPYDYEGVIHMIWEPLAVVRGFHWLMNKESLAKLYCSAYITAGFENSSVMAPSTVDYAETSPQDLAKKRLYGNLVQLKGALKEIPRFNTVDVDPPKNGGLVASFSGVHLNPSKTLGPVVPLMPRAA